ncbi:MAG: Holliday junction branch migration protein RuvA [Deltaproteobacteria bacterium]|jgi:Holliday junction DNA helicase RuvA
MIARISGLLIFKSISHAIVDAHGIGYRIFLPLTTFYELPDTSQPVTLHIHTHVKDDAINLFGFYSSEEKEVFQLMISVSGIGPKLALNILSGISAGDLIAAVSRGDLNRLIRIPGVGKKMAERIILELKDKMIKMVSFESVDKDSNALSTDELKLDALSALINLGYKNQSAKTALDRIINEFPEPMTLEILLKRTLKILAV